MTQTREVSGYKNAAALFRALGHPVRLEIVALLGHGEACVCHLQAILKKRQPYISQQLMALRDAGLVEDRRDGPMVYYRLTAENAEMLLEWAQAELVRQGMAPPRDVPPHELVEGCPCPKCSSC
jgi:DNA-binding transcriptional ArsR family regulator